MYDFDKPVLRKHLVDELSKTKQYEYCFLNNKNVDTDFHRITTINLNKFNYKVSFLFTTWNRTEYFKKAVDSINEFNYKNIEFIIVDDGSGFEMDEYVEKIKSQSDFLFKYIKTNGGNGPGINKRIGFNHCNGDYIVFMDDDDFYFNPLFLLKSFQIFSEHDSVAAIFYNSFILNMEKNQISIGTKLNLKGLHHSKYVLENFMSAINKPNSTFPAIFDLKKYKNSHVDKMKILNDTSIYLTGILSGDVYFCEDFVGVYRLHNGSMGKNLSIDYIIDNMNEKLNIAKYLNKEIDKEKWIRKQISITFNHYLNESNSINWLKLIKWVNHLPFRTRFYLLVRIPIQRYKYFSKKGEKSA